jgi:hypothetical protein
MTSDLNETPKVPQTQRFLWIWNLWRINRLFERYCGVRKGPLNGDTGSLVREISSLTGELIDSSEEGSSPNSVGFQFR